MDRRQHVVLHEPFAQDDRVFEVVALPRHERHEQVLAQREFAVIGRGAIGEDVTLLHFVAFAHARLLVDTGVLVRSLELQQLVDLLAERLVVDRDEATVEVGHHAIVLGEDHVGGIARGAAFDTGADIGRLGHDKWHRLALHVRAHQRSVGVVVFEERDQRRRHRDDLLGRHVHQLHVGW